MELPCSLGENDTTTAEASVLRRPVNFCVMDKYCVFHHLVLLTNCGLTNVTQGLSMETAINILLTALGSSLTDEELIG